jgi:hypothetical protein
MFLDNYDYSQHIWNDLFIAIVTVDFPNNRERVNKLQGQLLDNKLAKGYICYGKKAENRQERDDLVYRCHRDICEWFVLKKPCKHLFIVEDDAHICNQHIDRKIKRYLKILDTKQPNWLVLNLGCLSTSGLNHLHDDIFEGSGIAAHSYIHNGNVLGEYLRNIPATQWKSPDCVEKWSVVPKEYIYMTHPLLFSQEVHLTDIRSYLPGINDPFMWYYYINFVNMLNIYRYLIIFLLCILIFGLLKKLLQKTKV